MAAVRQDARVAIAGAVEQPVPENNTVQLPTIPRKMSVLAVIDQFTTQTGVTYLLRRGCIEIVPIDYAAIGSLMSQPVVARFENQPLRDVLQDLADLTGATIVLDARAAEAAREPISAVFRNNATLEDAMSDPVVLERMSLPGQSPYGTSRASLLGSPTQIGILANAGASFADRAARMRAYRSTGTLPYEGLA